MCDSYTPGGSASVRREFREAFQVQVVSSDLESTRLCDGCFEMACQVLDAAVGPNERRPKGASFSMVEGMLNREQCNFCRCFLHRESFVLDLVPGQRQTLGQHRYRYIGQLREFRLCYACLAWCRALFYDASDNNRDQSADDAEDAEPQRDLALVSDAASIHLLAGDARLLASMVRDAGYEYRQLRLRAPFTLEPEGPPVFVAAGTGSSATALLAAIEPAARPRVVVVARYDALEDLGSSLALGAGAFVTSPIDASQVTGAFARVRQALAGRAAPRHPNLGVRILPTTSTASERSSEMFGVTLKNGTPVIEAAWLLRRFLRGYDRVGVDIHGAPKAQTFCAPGDSAKVMSRIHALLGERLELVHEGTVDTRQKLAQPA